MKPGSLFFNVSVAILAAACTPASRLTHTTAEMKSEKSFAAKNDSLLPRLLRNLPGWDTLQRNAPAYGIQIIYTQIDRNKNNKPSFTHHYFGAGADAYFYPASTVKLPVAILALQKINELARPGLTRNTTMITEAAFDKQTTVYNDPEAADGRPTVSNYIKKILLVSDNDAYNRLYEFLGQEYINTTLYRMGYDSVQIIHRLSTAMNEEQNRHTNPVRFFDPLGNTVYEQPLVRSNLRQAQRHTLLGSGYVSGNQIVREPFNFSQKNRLQLSDLHAILQSILFPDDVPARQRFLLTADDYRFLRTYMSMKPSESRYPAYDNTYTDAYVKFLLFGGEGPITNPALRLFNKPGDAYGFLTDAAYIVDFDRGIEFILSATIYCNSDGIFNDDKYDYNTVGFPFMKALGRLIYEYESGRVKKIRPDLSAFKMDYAAQN